jgi:large subunit ribosomal protein L18
MNATQKRDRALQARHERIRRKVKGTPERPRLCVYRSLKHIYAQLVDDSAGKSLMTVSTLSREVRESLSDKKKSEASRVVGMKIAELAKQKGITSVCFDRGGFLYHGRVKAVADGAREGGLEF